MATDQEPRVPGWFDPNTYDILFETFWCAVILAPLIVCLVLA